MSLLKTAFRLASTLGKPLLTDCKSSVHTPKAFFMSFENLPVVSVADYPGYEGVKVLTLCRPPANALTLEIMQGISKIVHEVEQTSNVLIFKSALPSVFCAGMDLSAYVRADKDELHCLGVALHDMFEAVFATRLATLAVIDGAAMAGGCFLSTFCDYRIATKTSSSGLPESCLGIVPPWYLNQSLVRLVGQRQAEKALCFAEKYSAEEGLRMGLIDQVVDSADLMDEQVHSLIDKWLNVQQARATMKLELRQPLLDYARNNRSKILEDFIANRADPNTQRRVQERFMKIRKDKKKVAQ